MDPNFHYRVKYGSVVKYTDNFSPQNYIGDFEFGKIYRGVIRSAMDEPLDVVVKIWDTSSCVFRDNQLRLMRENNFLRHEDVMGQPAAVKLLGYVCDDEHLGLMYCLKASTTVCNQLEEDDFDWIRRIKVARWIAHMVESFHCKNPPYGPLVIHNIDAQYILLDEDYIPKLFSFDLMTGGMLFPQDRTRASHGEQGKHDDVFDFGLLLLSLILKRSINKGNALKRCSKWNMRESKSLVHVTFQHEPYFYACDGEQVSRLAMQCMNRSPNKRPSMDQVVNRLEKLQVVQNHGDLLKFKPKPVDY